MKYSIGLDLGINNVGWAIYDLDNKKIINKGVTRYKESSDAQERRATRGSRWLNKRRHHRVERLAIYLHSIGFNSVKTYQPDLLEKRVKGLNEKLSQNEITNIIYYFAMHRGYIPFDDEKVDREIHQLGYDEYPCLYISDYLEKHKKYRGTSDLILMKDNMRELRKILETQSNYYHEINNKTIESITDIISSKRQFHEGPGGAKESQLTPYGRYRNLEDLEKLKNDPNYHKYLYEMLIGKCEFSMDDLGNMENVAPTYNYYAEQFNFYNDFINMSVIEPSNISEEYRYKINTTNGKFTMNTILEFEKNILERKTFSFEKVLREVLNLELKDVQGYRIDKKHDPNISRFEHYKYIENQFKKAKLHPKWLYDEDKTNYNRVMYILTVAPASPAIEEMIQTRASDINISSEEIEVLKEIKRTKKSDLKYHSLSESIIKKSIYDMKKYEFEFNFMQLSRKLDYSKNYREYFQNNYSNQKNGLFKMNSDYVDEIIANPQVKKTLRKAIKIINAIIEEQNDYPYAIVIESTKEMNGKDEKARIEKEQKAQEEFRNNAKHILEENGYISNESNINRIINWQETNHQCAYCGKEIKISEVLRTDIEHILPKSKTYDSSNDNLTCACSSCNTIKKARTPFEFLTSTDSTNNYSDFKKRIKEEYKKMPEKKKEYLLFEGNIEKYSLKFINRNLRDTSYGTVALIKELEKYNDFLSFKTGYNINVISSPGKLTNKIRWTYKIVEDSENAKNRDFLYHHAVDAMILATLADTFLGNILLEIQGNKKYWLQSNYEKRKENEEFLLNITDNSETKEEPKKNYRIFKNDQIIPIKEFHKSCSKRDDTDKDGLLNRSYEVLRNPVRKFADANYVKYVLIKDQYYSVNQIDNIYDCDKAKLLKLFDENDQTEILLCENKDPKLFRKLKEILKEYANYDEPFKAYCLYKEGLENDVQNFECLIHGIKKTDKENSPVVIKLRYLKKVNYPYLKKNIKMKKENKYGEFIDTKMKESTKIGLSTLSSVFVRIYYDLDNQNFLFLPMPAVCFKNGKLDENDSFYLETYNRIIGNKNVKKIYDLHSGEWIKAGKKDGEFEGKFSFYHRDEDNLCCYLNGSGKRNNSLRIQKNVKYLIFYKIDILGNKHILLDTRDVI